MGDDGHPKAAAIPIGRAKQDTQEHARQKTFEFEMEKGKQKGGYQDADQRPLTDLDHDALQRTPKTKLLAESRNDRHDQQVDDRVKWMMHFQISVHQLVVVLFRFDHPCRQRNMFVQFTQPLFQWKREYQQQYRQEIEAVSHSRPKPQVISRFLPESQPGIQIPGKPKRQDRKDDLDQFADVDNGRIIQRRPARDAELATPVIV